MQSALLTFFPRSGPPLLVNTNVHWGQLKYLSSTTSQPNTKKRTKALATTNRQVKDLPTPPRGKQVPHGATAREPSIYVELPCFLIEVGVVKMFIVTFLVQVVERCKTQNVNDQLDETFELFVNN